MITIGTQVIPKLYEYNIGWGSLRYINREDPFIRV